MDHLHFHRFRDKIPVSALITGSQPRFVPAGVLFTIAGKRAINQAWVRRRQLFVPDAQPFCHSGSEVLDHDVGVGDQLLGSFLAAIRLQIQDHRPFAPVPGGKRWLGNVPGLRQAVPP